LYIYADEKLVILYANKKCDFVDIGKAMPLPESANAKLSGEFSVLGEKKLKFFHKAADPCFRSRSRRNCLHRLSNNRA
jgi:hypothetical protein